MEGHRLRVFENRVLRRIFGTERLKITGDWRKLQSEELHKSYSSSNIVRAIKSRWVGHVARMENMRNPYKISVGNAEEKRPLGRPNRRWEDNIRTDIRELVWEGVD
jgi:hypothetical protein